MTLNDFLVSEVFAFLMVFCRVGTAMMMLPGFGEAYISPRVRLLMAVFISIVIAPTLSNLPAPPASTITFTTMLFSELLIGIFIGVAARLLLSAISTGGTIIAFQSSLASAVVTDVSSGAGTQGSSLANLLSIAALVLIFTLDMHHLMIRALHDSYELFAFGVMPSIEDMSMKITQIVSTSFVIATQIAAHHIVIGLITYLAAGIIGKLMPAFQVFYIMTSPNLMLSFFVLMIAFNTIMMHYMDYFKTSISVYVGN